MNIIFWPFFVLSLFSMMTLPAAAQDYPFKPIRMVVPYPPGGAGDMHVRLVSQKLGAMLGQTVVVENRAGASGNIGAEYVVKSAPDGYTLVFGTTNMAINQAVSAKMPFNVLTDLEPITITLTSQNLLAVRTTMPANNMRELIAYAKANPGKVNFGSSGIGSPWLAVEILKSLAGVEMVHVPYKGDGPAIIDLIGGQIDIYATNISAVDAHHRAGKVRGLAVTSRKRSTSLPDIPTMEEAGVPGYDLEGWFGFLAPAGTPRPIIDKLHAALLKIVAMPDVQKSMLDIGLTPATLTPEEFRQRIQSDVAKFTRVVKSSGIKIE
jgi:tripartite-type tricarboxylate transporter receptor subunit TctC